jgi:threonine/homoserine/homoserine lactone efflux protein
MSLQVYLAFVAACIGLALIPGPVVTLVLAMGCATAPARR